MIDRTVRIGMIGCGAQANVHFDAVKELGEEIATVAAVCDLDDERLTAAGQVWPQARATKDYNEMLAPGDLDLVIVATMPNTHEAMSLASLEAGANVLCEKPFMMNAAEAQNVLAKAKMANLRVQLGTNMRYMTGSQYLHDLVTNGTIGTPVYHRKRRDWKDDRDLLEELACLGERDYEPPSNRNQTLASIYQQRS